MCELYSEAIAPAGLPGLRTSLRFMAGAGSADVVVVRTHAEPDHEGAVIELPAVVAELTPLARARLVLDAVDLGMRQLAALRGWPLGPIAAAREQVLDAGLVFAWTGRAVTSPDRRRVARAHFRLQDDGFGRVHLEILDKATSEIEGISRTFLAYSTIEGFRRASTSLRWLDRTHVRLTQYSDAFRLDERTTVVDLEADLQRLPDVRPHLRPRPSSRSAAVATVRVSPPAPAVPSIRGGGGGPMNDVPPLYQAAVMWLFDNISPELTAWWAATGLMELHVTYHYWGDDAQCRLYRRGDDLRATVRRPIGPDVVEDPVGVALGDLANVLAAVARRFALPPPPPLPSPRADDLRAAAEEHAHALDEDDIDLDAIGHLLPPDVLAVLQKARTGD